MERGNGKAAFEYRLGRIVGSVFENDDGSGRMWCNVSIVRLYRERDTGPWVRGRTFSRDDLPLVCEVARRCHLWIYEVQQERRAEKLGVQDSGVNA
jgi:hypothetical protein